MPSPKAFVIGFLLSILIAAAAGFVGRLLASYMGQKPEDVFAFMFFGVWIVMFISLPNSVEDHWC